MTESEVRDVLMKALFHGVGAPRSWVGEGSVASFAIKRSGVSGRCTVEGTVGYVLPDGTHLDHKSDIQIEYDSDTTSSPQKRYIAIEVKHASAVTDQFKARAFDMIHMKQALGSRLHGIIVFARIGTGIQLRRAQAICYPFDEFIGVDLSKADMGNQLAELCLRLKARVEVALDRSAG